MGVGITDRTEVTKCIVILAKLENRSVSNYLETLAKRDWNKQGFTQEKLLELFEEHEKEVARKCTVEVF